MTPEGRVCQPNRISMDLAIAISDVLEPGDMTKVDFDVEVSSEVLAEMVDLGGGVFEEDIFVSEVGGKPAR